MLQDGNVLTLLECRGENDLEKSKSVRGHRKLGVEMTGRGESYWGGNGNQRRWMAW